MQEKPDIFDKLFTLPGLRVFAPFFHKYREVLMYLLFGGLTTVVSIVSFALFLAMFEKLFTAAALLKVSSLIANVLSWILSVLFAYVTNRIWVFRSHADTPGGIVREMISFFGGRVFTLLVEEGILLVFITWLSWNAIGVKIAAQVIIVVLNYIISRLFVFRKKDKNTQNPPEEP